VYTHVYAFANAPGFALQIRTAEFSTVRGCHVDAMAHIPTKELLKHITSAI